MNFENSQLFNEFPYIRACNLKLVACIKSIFFSFKIIILLPNLLLLRLSCPGRSYYSPHPPNFGYMAIISIMFFSSLFCYFLNAFVLYVIFAHKDAIRT